MEKNPRQRRSQRNRQEIIDAAREILISQGVEGISIRAVAEKADYSPSALYRYFASKEEILSALREEGRQLNTEIQRQNIRQDVSIHDLFMSLASSYLEFSRQYPAHYQLIMNPSDDVPENFEALRKDPQFTGLLAFTESFVSSGKVKLPDGFEYIHLAFLMWFVAHGASMAQITMLRNCPQEFDAISEKVFLMLANLLNLDTEKSINLEK